MRHIVTLIAFAWLCSTAACSGLVLKEYVPPATGSAATLLIQNKSQRAVGVHIYENAFDCSQKRRVIWVQPGSAGRIKIKAPEPTAFSFNYEYLSGANLVYCLTPFSLAPKVSGEYVVSFADAPGGCSIGAIEKTARGETPITLTKRIFKRPLSEEGAFCSPL
jgi:hypothetical protein